jgi:Pup amidohydrolase
VTVFRRLLGLETEYAVRFRAFESVPDAGSVRVAASRPTDYELYQRLLFRLRELLPIAEAATDEPGHFLATGGAVKFERFWQAAKSGLIEGATPECRSPRDLLVWQRAQDRLFSEAARKAGEPDGEFVLIKNNRDSRQRTYGSHENYEVPFAGGPMSRFAWRAGLLLLMPLIVVEWALLILVIVPALVLFWMLALGAWMAARLRAAVLRKPPPELSRFLGEGLFSDDKHVMPWPRWFEPAIVVMLVMALLPLIAAVWVLLRLTAFRRQRSRLLPFLVTRTIFSGAGCVDRRGEFRLAQKATAVNSVYGFYAIVDKPVFSFGNLLESIVLMPLAPHRFKRLFDPRQRLQVCLGDSNRCEEAEYLRLATTALVLDAIDAGVLTRVPRMWRPLRANRIVGRDESLSRPVARFRGRKLRAIDVQRFYLNACRDYVTAVPNPPGEAWDVLERWEDVLDRLEDDRQSLVGRVDWITKRFLLDTVERQVQRGEPGASATGGRKPLNSPLPPDALRKIDIRYHEVSPNGYFERLQQAGWISTLVTEDELQRAMRNAPAATPAAVRGRYIREFADGDVPLRVDWQSIQLGEGKERHVVPLGRAGRDA